MNTHVEPFDVLVVGSGLAGLTTALELANGGRRVAIITKRCADTGATAWAQGGIAAVLGANDDFAQHEADTHQAGGGLCDAHATRLTVERAPHAIRWLQAQGVAFSQEGQALHLTREGGHSQRRIVHAADFTGRAVQEALLQRAREHSAIEWFEHHMLVDLITSQRLDAPGPNRCLGAYVLNEATDTVQVFAARATVLATGGAGKVYLYTTNPDTATGDGMAAAWRAGCRVANMEFVQFHPTCLFHPHAKSFLISEAVRGEGGVLRLPESAGGTRFMPAHDARAELAPRDVVARAIDFEMKRHGVDCVYLDITHQNAAFLQHHFPTIRARCAELGIDIAQQPIPVVPAAHYSCGGVMVNHHAATDVACLYAVGETSYTGLHGANRLASNSLLECVVYAQLAAAHITQLEPEASASLPAWDDSQVTDADEQVVIAHNWEELRRFMWDYVGIVRTNKRLERAAHRIALLHQEIQEFYASFHVTRDLLELRNLVQVADLIVQSAQQRHESRGLHFSLDYPQAAANPQPSVLRPA